MATYTKHIKINREINPELGYAWNNQKLRYPSIFFLLMYTLTYIHTTIKNIAIHYHFVKWILMKLFFKVEKHKAWKWCSMKAFNVCYNYYFERFWKTTFPLKIWFIVCLYVIRLQFNRSRLIAPRIFRIKIVKELQPFSKNNISAIIHFCRNMSRQK